MREGTKRRERSKGWRRAMTICKDPAYDGAAMGLALRSTHRRDGVQGGGARKAARSTQWLVLCGGFGKARHSRGEVPPVVQPSLSQQRGRLSHTDGTVFQVFSLSWVRTVHAPVESGLPPVRHAANVKPSAAARLGIVVEPRTEVALALFLVVALLFSLAGAGLINVDGPLQVVGHCAAAAEEEAQARRNR